MGTWCLTGEDPMMVYWVVVVVFCTVVVGLVCTQLCTKCSVLYHLYYTVTIPSTHHVDYWRIIIRYSRTDRHIITVLLQVFIVSARCSQSTNNQHIIKAVLNGSDKYTEVLPTYISLTTLMEHTLLSTLMYYCYHRICCYMSWWIVHEYL